MVQQNRIVLSCSLVATVALKVLSQMSYISPAVCVSSFVLVIASLLKEWSTYEAECGSDTDATAVKRPRKPLIYGGFRYIVSSRRDMKIYYKCCHFRKQCKARLVADLLAENIALGPHMHSHESQHS